MKFKEFLGWHPGGWVGSQLAGSAVGWPCGLARLARELAGYLADYFDLVLCGFTTILQGVYLDFNMILLRFR